MKSDRINYVIVGSFVILMLAGIVITVCFAVTMRVMFKDYAQAEQRKMLAKDL